jgi:hypothetical protein
LGFETIRAQDITSNVIPSIESMVLGRGAPEKRVENEFLALLHYLEKMKEGEYIYKVYTARKK